MTLLANSYAWEPNLVDKCAHIISCNLIFTLGTTTSSDHGMFIGALLQWAPQQALIMVCLLERYYNGHNTQFTTNTYVLDLKISLYKLFNDWSLLKWHGEVCWNDTVKFAEMTRWSLLKWHGEICWNDTVKFAEMTRWSLLKWHGEVSWNGTVKKC